MNPNVLPNEPRLTITVEGPVYSKRRMLIVLWKHKQDMVCLPLFSHEGTGLNKKQHIIEEYICVMNVGDGNFQNPGRYPLVEAAMKHGALTPETTVHLACPTRVGYSENIAKIGQITEESHRLLVESWKDLCEEVRAEPWVY
jgi:hypothetical protein